MIAPLAGQVGLVTGGSRGIGRAVAMRLAQAGAHVHFSYRTHPEAANATLEEIRAAGGQAETLALDVTCAEECQQAVEAILARHGRLDFLVNNAGITHDGLVIRMKDDAWDRVIAANLTGSFKITRAALGPMMKAKRGRIILISSVVGLGGNAGQANYAASKAGLIGLAKSLAKEYASRGILVNAVAPGVIDTDMTHDILEKGRKPLEESIPLGRIGTAEEVAGAVLFLLGPDAGYITGQTLAVCGGLAI